MDVTDLRTQDRSYVSHEATGFLVSLDGATVDWVLVREEGCSAVLLAPPPPEGPELPRQAWGQHCQFQIRAHSLPGLCYR